jgi:hypothetical protein
MKVLKEILTILNLCTVQLYGIFDSYTSLHQSLVPAIIVHKEIRKHSQKTIETLKSIQPASLSQKCLKSVTAIIVFISVNDRLLTNLSVDPPQNDLTLNRYKPLLEQVSTYSNPAFILLQIHPKMNKFNLKFDWTKLPITSHLLLFNAEDIYSPTIDPGPKFRITFDTRAIIRSQLSSLKSKLNLMGRYVEPIGGSISRRQKISDCSLNLDKLLTLSALCIIQILEKQINFTTISPPRNKQKYSSLQLFNVVANNHANNMIITKRIPGLHWLTHGVHFEPYKLILITKLERVNVDSLLQPFDRNIWMAILAANSLFFIVVCIGLEFRKKCKLGLWMMSTLFTQTDEMLTRCLFDKKRWINFALVSSWLFSMFLLNVLYQGDLYSCLSNVRLPILPNSLRETLATKIPLYTTGESCHVYQTGRQNRTCSSTLLNMLIPDILKTKEADEILRNLALKLLSRAEQIPGNPVLIAFEMAINSDNFQILNKSWNTPRTFGILASSQQTDEFTAAAKVFFKEHIIRPTTDVNPFITITPWMAQRGLFATAFSSGIASLSQSGLIERWRKHLLKGKVMHIIKTKFKSMHDLENWVADTQTTQKQILRNSLDGYFSWESSGRLYSRFMLVPDKDYRSVSVHSVPFEVMKLPFLACLVSISFSTGVLLVECVAKKILKVKN